MDRVKWGIIGCGNVTEVKSGPAFNKVGHSKLVAVMRRDAVKAEDYARRHNVPVWYTDVDKLINDPKVNAVYVATPPDTHAVYAIKALKSGKPVYVEKPMASNYSGCISMIEASKQYKKPLFVAYYRRCLPGFLKVKELINNREIGQPLIVNIKLYKAAHHDEINGNLPWRVIPEIAGAGHFYDLASHQLDYLDYLFGPIIKVKGIATNQGKFYKAEDTVSASFQFKNGVIGNGSWCFVTSPDNYCDEIEITGTKGKIDFSTFEFIPIKLTNKKGEQFFPYEKPDHVQYYLINEIVKELTGKGKSPSTGETGARTNWVLEEIVREYYNKI